MAATTVCRWEGLSGRLCRGPTHTGLDLRRGGAVQRRHRCSASRRGCPLIRRHADETKYCVRGKIGLEFRYDPGDEPSRRLMSGQMPVLARSFGGCFASDPPISRLGFLSLSALAVRLHPCLDLLGVEVSGGTA